MDGLALDIVPSDGAGTALADLIASLAPAPILSLALVVLIAVAGIDTARAVRGDRR